MPDHGRYRAITQLASGGMGEVFLAEDASPAPGAPAVVAIKRVAASVASDPELLRSFRHEAQLLKVLSHRHIVRVVDVGEDEQGSFVAMELVEGPSLRLMLQRLAERGQRLPAALALDIAAQVGDALAFAYYARGPDNLPLRIIHRDVSPRNILISHAGEAKLIDFGIAQSLRQAPVPSAGARGKVGYLSPEQLASEPLNARSNLFSLGIVLCEMLSGQHPFERASAEELAAAIRRDAPHLPSASVPELGVCDPLLLRLLAKRPSDRFADGLEVAKELAKLRGQVQSPPERLGELVCSLFEVGAGERRALKASSAAPRASGKPLSPRPAPSRLSRRDTLRFFPPVDGQSLPETATDPQFPWIEPSSTPQGPSSARPSAAAPTAAVRIFLPGSAAGHGPLSSASALAPAHVGSAGQALGHAVVRFFARNLRVPGERQEAPPAKREPTRPAVIQRFPPRKAQAKAAVTRVAPAEGASKAATPPPAPVADGLSQALPPAKPAASSPSAPAAEEASPLRAPEAQDAATRSAEPAPAPVAGPAEAPSPSAPASPPAAALEPTAQCAQEPEPALATAPAQSPATPPEASGEAPASLSVESPAGSIAPLAAVSPSAEASAAPAPSAQRAQPLEGTSRARAARNRGWRAAALLALAAGLALAATAALRGKASRLAVTLERASEPPHAPPPELAAAQPAERAELRPAALALEAPSTEAAPPQLAPAKARADEIAPAKAPADELPLRRASTLRAKQVEAHKLHKAPVRRDESSPRLGQAEPVSRVQSPSPEARKPEVRKPTFSLAVSGPTAPCGAPSRGAHSSRCWRPRASQSR